MLCFICTLDSEDFCWKVGHMTTAASDVSAELTASASSNPTQTFEVAPVPLHLLRVGPHVNFLCVQEELEHEDHCAICEEDGELQPCHSCPRAFHPNCLHPPLKTPPRGPWYCPKCQKKVLHLRRLPV